MVFEFLSKYVGSDSKKQAPAKVQQDSLEDNSHIAELEELMTKARKAQSILESYSQEEVDRIIKGLVYACSREAIAKKISDLAVDESKLGNVQSKFAKMFSKTRAALSDIIHEKSIGIIEEDEERQILKIAKPMGIIFAVVPCTNPEATPVIKAINAIKGRNAIIFSANSKTIYVNEYISAQMRLALLKLGAPEDIIQVVDSPNRRKTNYMLQHSDFNLVTGANSIVKAAYRSGVPSLGVGVGNAVISVMLKPHEEEDLKEAARKIKISKTFDFAASCSADNSILCLKSSSTQLLKYLKAVGGHVLTSESDISKLRNTIFDLSSGKPRFRREAIVRSAQVIAKLANIDVPETAEFLIVPRKQHQVGSKFPLSGEKLTPVVTFYNVNSIDEAINLTNKIHAYQGQGHSCGIFTNNNEEVERYSLQTYTSRVMVNQPQSLSNSGNLWNGMRQTFSLGCGTWGGNSTTENINWRHLVNITYVSKPLQKPKTIPCDEDLFGKEVMNVIDAE